MEERSLLSLPFCSHSRWQVHSFIGFRTNFLAVLAYAKDQLRHQTHELNNAWILEPTIDRQPLLNCLDHSL